MSHLPCKLQVDLVARAELLPSKLPELTVNIVEVAFMTPKIVSTTE